MLGWTELVGPVLMSVDRLIEDRRSEEEKEGRGESGGGRALDWDVEIEDGG